MSRPDWLRIFTIDAWDRLLRMKTGDSVRFEAPAFNDAITVQRRKHHALGRYLLFMQDVPWNGGGETFYIEYDHPPFDPQTAYPVPECREGAAKPATDPKTYDDFEGWRD